MLETIEEKRERIMRETARRNARQMRKNFWTEKYFNYFDGLGAGDPLKASR